MSKFDLKKGVIKLNNKFYKSFAVFKKDVYYSEDELNLLLKATKNKKQKTL